MALIKNGYRGSPKSGERGNALLRKADYFLGIPAILLIGLFKRALGQQRRPLPTNPAVIGLLKASGIGDAIILSGVIRDLRLQYPNARLVLFSGKSNHAFARLLDHVDVVEALPVTKPLTALRIIRAARPVIMLDFGMWPRLESLLATLSGAKWVAGVRTPGQHRHFGYDEYVDHSKEHEITNYRNVVKLIGIESESLPSLSTAQGLATPDEVSYVILHLWPGGANARERSWPLDNWKSLTLALNREGYKVVLSGGPDDVSSTNDLVRLWQGSGLDIASIAGLSAENTIRWLRHATGVISVNTGLLHLAAAVGAPVIALNGPTSGRRWGPIGRHARCVQSPDVPNGYLNLGWETDVRFQDCMRAISVEMVMAEWGELQQEIREQADSSHSNATSAS